MRISEKGLRLIRAFEGFSAKPYLCPAQVWTIGYGHTRGVTQHSLPIDEQTAQELLRKDVEASEKAVRYMINVVLTQGQFDALVSFVFNLGAGRLQASTLRKKVNAGDHAGAAGEFKKWVLAGGKKQKGLIRRREAERHLYLSVEAETEEPLPPPSEQPDAPAPAPAALSSGSGPSQRLAWYQQFAEWMRSH